MKINNTREASTWLRTIADFLDSRPEFNLEHYSPEVFHFYDKDTFVAAAKALGNANKNVDDGEYAYFRLVSTASPVTLTISRDKVCTKKVVYNCEPLFSPEDIANL